MKMKKIIAWMSVIALASTMFVSGVSAANANPTLTYNDVSTDVNVTSDTLQIVIPANINAADWDTAVLTFRDSAWALVNMSWEVWSIVDTTNAVSTERGDASWKVDVVIATAASATDSTLTFAAETIATWIYTVNVVWTAWVWAATFAVNWANEITVTAQVEPILTMEVEWNVNFWTLTANTPTYVNADISYDWNWTPTVNTWTVITIWTNATDWYVVQAQNVWLISWTDEIFEADADDDDSNWYQAEDLSQAWNYGYWIYVNEATVPTNTLWNVNDWNEWESFAWLTIDWVISAVFDFTNSKFKNWGTATAYVGMDSTTPLEVSKAAWPVAWQVTAISYWVKISEMQAAWNYTDTVTYTVTWNF